MSRTKWIVVAGLVLVVLATAGVVTWRATHSTYAQLKGVWYQSSTGLKYDFTSPTQLVIPITQPNGGNTIGYKIVDDNKLAFTQNGATQVLEIKKLDGDQLVTHDPASGQDKAYFRDLGRTDFAQNRAKIAAGALAAIKRFPTIVPQAKIVWTVVPPSGNMPAWPLWSTSTMDVYRKAWSWSDVKAADASVDTSGSGSSTGYAVVFKRTVPTAETLTASSQGGRIVEPGGPFIDVGYSASMAKYPAGTFVYLSSGIMVYSLGGGYALGVRVGPSESVGFVPYTYRQR